ncbi:uncharacterized protein B0T23DRAFT_432640 [Neurospora hispaniola]|uniref:Uncharacterized protein n=1 Tax=Neurospora hispaniola TaxID=588809 RepID=A0AAJ0HZU5_9PEZI|nr:hypothetical protein B0T23DRAFT_432640 [Neurospora hispaniola]
MLIGKMLKLSQQLNKLSKPILVYLAALQDVPVNPIHIATAAAATTTTTTTTSYYVAIPPRRRRGRGRGRRNVADAFSFGVLAIDGVVVVVCDGMGSLVVVVCGVLER